MMYDILYYIGRGICTPKRKGGGLKMGCIKCGKKTKQDQTFCPQCLKVMEAYPVKADVHVQLPSRPAEPAKKPARKKRAIPPEIGRAHV